MNFLKLIFTFWQGFYTTGQMNGVQSYYQGFTEPAVQVFTCKQKHLTYTKAKGAASQMEEHTRDQQQIVFLS